jgi:hypothetical protein
LTKNTGKKSQAEEEKTKATQAEIDEFSARISDLVGQTAGSVSRILDDTTHKIKDLAGDESLKPLFKDLGEYLKQEFKPMPSVFDLFGKAPKPPMPDIAKYIGPRDFDKTSGLMSAFVKENRSWESFGFALERLREERGLKPTDLYHPGAN